MERVYMNVEELRLRNGLGEKYNLYEKLAREGKFDEIPEHEMSNNYRPDSSGRIGGFN